MMRIKAAIAERDDWCEQCGYPFDAGDVAFIVNDDTESRFCGVNCATRSKCDRNLSDMVEEAGSLC